MKKKKKRVRKKKKRVRKKKKKTKVCVPFAKDVSCETQQHVHP